MLNNTSIADYVNISLWLFYWVSTRLFESLIKQELKPEA